GLHPAAEPDAGGSDDHVQGIAQAALGRRAQLAVVGEGNDPDGGRRDHPRAPAFEGGGELLPAPGGRDADRVAGQRLGTHPAFTSTRPSRRRTGKTGTDLPSSSRQAPVRRSKTCLCSGDATVGMPPLVPTMPRESTNAPVNGSWFPIA